MRHFPFKHDSDSSGLLQLIPFSLNVVVLTAAAASCSSAPPPQYVFSNPPPNHAFETTDGYRIPSVHESAVLARRILNLSSIATLATVFPSSSSPSFHVQNDHNEDGALLSTTNSLTPPPPSLPGSPIGLMDYYASCPPFPSNPTILAISIATSFRNTHAGSNLSLSLRWHPPTTAKRKAAAAAVAPSSDEEDGDDDDDDPYTYSPANMPRFSLEGYIEPIPNPSAHTSSKDGLVGIEECFFARHPDARAWRPGNAIHESWWAGLVVQGVYWIGGFGDRAYIGWIPVEEWEGVTDEEVRRARLVGEDGWNGSRGRSGGGDVSEALVGGGGSGAEL